MLVEQLERRAKCYSPNSLLGVGGVVLFVCQAPHHVVEATATAHQLLRLGVPSGVLLKSGARGFGRPSYERARQGELVLRRLGWNVVASGELAGVLSRAKCVVLWNDWGSGRSWVEAAREMSIPSIGWVEDAQDFCDCDTKRVRLAYRRVDYVFALGCYDSSVLDGQVTSFQVGSQQLWDLYHGSPSSGEIPLLANVNFSYGVLKEHRASWTSDVIAASRRAGVHLQISRHPADKGLRGRWHEVGKSTDTLLPSTGRFVSRFSTAIYAALALGVEVVYHNPHGERVTTFSESLGGFRTTKSQAELTDALRQPVGNPRDNRMRAAPFLRHHLRLEGEEPSYMAARIIAEMVRG